MLCGYPKKIGNRTLSCGKCMNCRINRKRSWVGRLATEHMYAVGPSTFLTLTYNDDHLPENASLKPDDWKMFYDRLRKTGLGRFRYYAVGEYGDKYERPHYHALLFGVDPWKWRDRINKCWTDKEGEPYGYVQSALVKPGAIDYVADYACKRLTGDMAEEVLKGRVPEFQRMSKKPPLGAQAIRRIYYGLLTRQGCIGLASAGDVPSTYRFNGKVYPLTTYWREWLRKELNVEKPSYEDWEYELGETQKDRTQAELQARKNWNWQQTKNKRRKAL